MNEMKNQSGKNYPDERIISLWFTRLMSGQYKFKNCSQGLNTSDFGAKIMVLAGSSIYKVPLISKVPYNIIVDNEIKSLPMTKMYYIYRLEDDVPYRIAVLPVPDEIRF